jgi:hypothetical protein
VAAQLAEQLLQVGQRDLLPLADRRQRHRAVVPERSARSIIAVTAKRPLVVSRMKGSPEAQTGRRYRWTGQLAAVGGTRL